MSGLFAQYQPEYAAHGISTIPCSTDAKQPLVGNYLKMGVNVSNQLASKVKFFETNALGIVTGKRNGITIIDIDLTDERVRDDAISRHGEPRLIVRTASRKHHLYYRHNGERRRIRPWSGRPIDILGDGGFAMAAPSLHGAGRYEIIHGRLDDLANLKPAAHIKQFDQKITEGNRNNFLWEHCMRQARSCDSFDDLLDVARTENEMNLMPPLPDAEVISTASSAWRYTEEGQNRFGQHGFFASTADIDDFMIENQDAFLLLTFLRGHNKPGSVFMCANGLADTLGWRRQRLASARSRLIECGRLRQVRQASKGQPALFTWLPITRRQGEVRGSVS